MKTFKLLLVVLMPITLSSCTIYDNDVEGEVDLVYSSTITIRANDFVSEDEFVSVANYGWDNLDVEMVDYGLVLGYIRFEGTTAWHALPYSIPFEDDLVNLRYSFDVDNISLVLEGEVADNNQANEALFDGDVLRVIAIPPSEIIRTKAIDYRNYDQIKELYNIE
ncbi:hypothetical protein [Gracilimonas sp.]|uniref:hypothetical protein n=1 Tax=Gracilimonas sp. TaxID=1974203 RepID=UPI003BA9C09E